VGGHESAEQPVARRLLAAQPYADARSARHSRNLGIALTLIGIVIQGLSMGFDALSWIDYTSTHPTMNTGFLAAEVISGVVGSAVTGAGVSLWIRGAQDMRHAVQVRASLSGLTVRF
jgi:hypothetical protein